MKPYGMKRLPELEYPDVGDITNLALQSNVGRISRNSDGDCRGYAHGNSKQRMRRLQKRSARRQGKIEASSTDE